MLKNISFLALASALTLSATGCIIVTDDGSDTNNGDSETGTPGDGDGDPGDGDGDGAPGDGDGDGAPGDGDGDGAPGDGDGDGAPAPSCGWSEADMWYACGFEGADPSGTNPIECPAGLVDGEPCANTGLTNVGCCDANGDNWYCTNEGDVAVFDSCAG